MAESKETLSHACTPLLLFLAGFRRNATTSPLGLDALSAALRREVEQARRRCDADPRLRRLFDRALYLLATTADQLVLSSEWSQRAGWQTRLLEMHYFKTAVGGRRFFALVDQLLEDVGDDAQEIAELAFHCVALGFRGELLNEPRELERRRRALYDKARLGGRTGEGLTPEAYQRNLTRRAMKLPAVGILRALLITVLALLIALVLGKSLAIWRHSKNFEGIKGLTSQLLSGRD